MKAAMVAIAFLISGAATSASAAEVGGGWRVSGRVSSFAFTLNCQFKPAGRSLAGVCVDASTNSAKVEAGKSHVLTSGSVYGDAVTWTYRSNFLLSKFDVTYRGTVTGNRMTGSIAVQGREGTFTAVRG